MTRRTMTAFIDALFLIVFVFFLLPINPDEAKTEEVKSPGRIIVEVAWPDDRDADIDLWVKAPQQRPVGYSRKNGVVFNLLRDDLGNYRDLTDVNHEIVYSRGAPPGEYVVNLHFYNHRGGPLPVPIEMLITIQNSDRTYTYHLDPIKTELGFVGQEITVTRFSINEEGRFVQGSVHDFPMKLRSAK